MKKLVKGLWISVALMAWFAFSIFCGWGITTLILNNQETAPVPIEAAMTPMTAGDVVYPMDVESNEYLRQDKIVDTEE